MTIGRIVQINVRPRGGGYRLEVRRNTAYGPLTITREGSNVQATLRDIEADHVKMVEERARKEAQAELELGARAGGPAA